MAEQEFDRDCLRIRMWIFVYGYEREKRFGFQILKLLCTGE